MISRELHPGLSRISLSSSGLSGLLSSEGFSVLSWVTSSCSYLSSFCWFFVRSGHTEICLKLLLDNFFALARMSLRGCGALKDTSSGRGFDAGGTSATAAATAAAGWDYTGWLCSGVCALAKSPGGGDIICNIDVFRQPDSRQNGANLIKIVILPCWPFIAGWLF